jgi:hypothetical protein
MPDVEVKPTQTDVAAGLYADGADPVLSRAIELLKEQRQR